MTNDAPSQHKEPMPIFVPNSLSSGDFYKWLFDTIVPYVSGRTLQLDAGDGSVSSLFLQEEIPLYLSDSTKQNRDNLRSKFKEMKAVKDILAIDLQRPDFMSYYSFVFKAFQTIIAVDLENIQSYTHKFISNAKLLLKKRGTLIMISPAHTTLYSNLEQGLEDLKHYNRMWVKDLLGADFNIYKTRYYNLRATSESFKKNQFGLSILIIATKLK